MKKRNLFHLLVAVCGLFIATSCGSSKGASTDNSGYNPPQPPKPTTIHVPSGSSSTDAPADNPGFHIGN
ncbi:MAG: hypothetical protein IKX22_12640 [Prevotella sp.]|nr:hypothetical protein [Prevotella sp.]